jgi:hypothetical protein
MLPFFGGTEVRTSLGWNELIAAMQRTLAEFSKGKFLQPVRSHRTPAERIASPAPNREQRRRTGRFWRISRLCGLVYFYDLNLTLYHL